QRRSEAGGERGRALLRGAVDDLERLAEAKDAAEPDANVAERGVRLGEELVGRIALTDSVLVPAAHRCTVGRHPSHPEEGLRGLVLTRKVPGDSGDRESGGDDVETWGNLRIGADELRHVAVAGDSVAGGISCPEQEVAALEDSEVTTAPDGVGLQ